MSRSTEQLPRWAHYGLIPLLNIGVALLVAGAAVDAIGESPLDAIRHVVAGAFGFGEGIAFTLYYATSFIFTGLAVSVAYQCGLFNIGAEGQAYVGGLGVALACLGLGDIFPWYITALVAVVAAAAAGGLWAIVPGYLQAKRGSHVVITTIMFNFIASALMAYLLVHVLRPEGSMSPQTRAFGPGGVLPHLAGPLSALGIDIGAAPLNVSFPLALLAAAGTWVFVWRTKLGYGIRTTGRSVGAARYAGIPYTRMVVVAMTVSGALAAMTALNIVMGDHGRLQVDFVGGAGFTGIAVALMGRNNPIGIVVAAVLFGALYQGGAELAFWVPNISREMVVLIQGLVVLFAGALEHMFRPALVNILSPRRAAATKP